MPKMIWVKKLFGAKEWENFYSHNTAYTFIEKGGDRTNQGIVVGFMVANEIPINCMPCSDEELVIIDKNRRATNTRPFPLEDKNEESH